MLELSLEITEFTTIYFNLINCQCIVHSSQWLPGCQKVHSSPVYRLQPYQSKSHSSTHPHAVRSYCLIDHVSFPHRQSSTNLQAQNAVNAASAMQQQMLTKQQQAAANAKPGQVNPSGKFVICEICDGLIKDLDQLRNHMQWMHKVKVAAPYMPCALSLRQSEQSVLMHHRLRFFFAFPATRHAHRFTRR